MAEKPSYNELEAYVKKLEAKVSTALHTERINKTLFDIVNSLNSVSSLQGLYQSIHRSLGNLMDMTNFYIAIYYQKRNAIRFVYHMDIKGPYCREWIENFTQNRSLTGDVILAKKPILLGENQLLMLGREKRVRGPIPKVWLGVPLMIKEDVLGVMAVQSYTNPEQFGRSDVDVLSFVSGQIALAIEKKRAEALLKKTQEKLIRSEKLEAIGTLAGGIAHDFNNTLSITLGNINLAQLMSDGVELTKFLTNAEASVMQAKELASRFIVFSKGGGLVKKSINSKTFIAETLASIAEAHKIYYRLDMGEVPEQIEVDPKQLKEALKNVVLNAHEAIKSQEKVSILFSPHPVKKGSVVISVIDPGKGVEKANLKKVFEPYYSTKVFGKDKGVGLGLSLAYSIVKNHQGEIRFSSTPGKGTRVDIILPVHQKQEKKETEPAVPDPPNSSEKLLEPQSETILIMDDDDRIREVIAKILSRLGYSAVLAKDGEQAVQLYEDHLRAGEKISRAILDLEVKQGMGGAEAIKKLLKLNPEIKAIISSGYSSDRIMENCRDYGFALALSKPFNMQTLKTALAQLQ